MKFLKLDLSFSKIISITVVTIVCTSAFVSIKTCQQELKKIISQNEQIQINLSKTKNNSDLQKLLAEYHINNANYSKQFYEKQSDWLNIWLIFVGIILTSMALFIPFKFSDDLKRIEKDGHDIINDIQEKGAQTIKVVEDSAKQSHTDFIYFKLEHELSLQLQWLGTIEEEKRLEQVTSNLLLFIDTECDDNNLNKNIKNDLYVKVLLQKSLWYMHHKQIVDAYIKSIQCVEKALLLSPDNLDLYIHKSYIIATGNEEDKCDKVIELLEWVLDNKCTNAKQSALNTIYYNLAEAYILSGINNNLLKAINLLPKIDITKIHKNVLVKDFMCWKQKLQNAPDSSTKQQIIKFIEDHS